MASQKHTHKHLVALPLAAVLLSAIGLADAALPLSASALASARHALSVSAAEASKEIDLPGLHLSLEAGAEARTSADGTHTVVTTGTILADAPGLATLSLPCLTLSLLHSAAYASVTGDGVSVAAVRGPVLLHSCTDASVLLAEGEQAFISTGTVSVASVPQTWLADIRSRLDSRPPADAGSDVYSTTFDAGASSADALKALDAAAEDSELSVLLAFALLPDLPRFDASVSDRVQGALFVSDALRADVVRALPRTAANERVALLETTIAEWTRAAAVRAAADPASFLSVTELVALLPSSLDDAGYPKQSRLWMKALQDTVTVLRPLAAASERETLDTLLARAQNHASPSAVPDPTFLVPAATLSDDELTARTERMLDDAEVLRTAATTVTPDAASGTARVERVAVPENGRDVTYDFTYAPETGVLSGIVRDGVKVPNKMKAELLFPLLRKEAP